MKEGVGNQWMAISSFYLENMLPSYLIAIMM